MRSQATYANQTASKLGVAVALPRLIPTIDVELPAFREPTFKTPGEAIAYAQKRVNLTRRGEDLTPYVGQTVVAAQWRDEVFRRS